MYTYTFLLAEQDVLSKISVSNLENEDGHLAATLQLGSRKAEVFTVKAKNSVENVLKLQRFIFEWKYGTTDFSEERLLSDYIVTEYVNSLGIDAACCEEGVLRYILGVTKQTAIVDPQSETWSWIFREGDPFERLLIARLLRDGYKIVEVKGTGVTVITPSRTHRSMPKCSCKYRFPDGQCAHELFAGVYAKNRLKFIKAGVASLI